jgi:hypothetical protein
MEKMIMLPSAIAITIKLRMIFSFFTIPITENVIEASDKNTEDSGNKNKNLYKIDILISKICTKYDMLANTQAITKRIIWGCFFIFS